MEKITINKSEVLNVGTQSCCICGKHFQGIGNNPEPVMDAAQKCCDECAWYVVIQARLIISKAISAARRGEHYFVMPEKPVMNADGIPRVS